MGDTDFDNIKTPEDFQNLLQEAAKLKTSQLNHKRREYMNSPQFMQNTLHPNEAVLEARKAEPEQRLTFANTWKTDGNTFFKSGAYEDAVNAYTTALGVFRYFEDHGEDRLLKENLSNMSPEQVKEAEGVVQSCFLNLAASFLKLKADPSAVIYACNQVLNVDPNNAKALYRQALAHEALEETEGSVHLDTALKLLKQAASADPRNKDVREAYKRVLAARGTQDTKDKSQFGGMFGRGELYNNDDKEEVPQEEIAPPGCVKRNGLWYDSETGRLMI